MKIKICIVIVLFIFVNSSKSDDFVVGTRVNNILVSTQKLVVSSFPLIRRDKDYFYQDPKQRIIKGIIVRDLSRTGADVKLTSGGIGSTNVSLHFKSARGEGINHLILIFSNNR